MTLLIQRAEHRDTQALQAKMDELLHAHARADNAMTKIDEKESEDIVRHRSEARAADQFKNCCSERSVFAARALSKTNVELCVSD